MRWLDLRTVSLFLLAASMTACGASAPESDVATAEVDMAAPSGSADVGEASVKRRAKQQEAEHLRQLIARGEFDASDLEVGSGASAETGNTLSLNYVGMLADGTVFDQTGNRPFVFRLGDGAVIPGWERGVAHMRVGGKRRLIIPADLAYGARGAPPKIPPNATIVFDVELVAVEP